MPTSAEKRAPAARRKKGERLVGPDPLWFKSAVIYQLHVRSFCDSTGDGVGDFNGLISRLDYLADLGVTALWLQPFYPSPLRDDGYDIADYVNINPAYGRIEDFRAFVQEAHRRGLRVITELVVNHTSDQHQWFQRARRSPKGSPERDFYVWSDTPDRYSAARIIFKDFERSNWTWDPVAEQYFWHRFYSHQPDLNFDNPAVHRAVLEVCDFWMKLGVDGVRLDAVPYLYEREGTSCENLPETHAFLRKLRAHVDARWPGRMLLAEANQWPEDAVAYFGAGDECHMAFHFPLMPRLFMGLRMEDRFPITDILDQTPGIPESCQWAMFLRNHDELTLEMVTDEERDYMYRVYASDPRARINLGIRRRLTPLLSNNRRKIELMNALLFSMPGTPIIYYGDEIGMGDNVHLGDRNSVRTPMQWSADRNAGFSRANPQSLFLPIVVDPEYHYEAINVESQLANPSSILWWMKRLIALRKRYPVLGTGAIRFIQTSNPRVLAFLRHDATHTLLVVANLSRFVQPVEVPLGEFEGMRPTEVFGRVPFPAVGAAPYFLSLGPHGFFWFLLERTAPAGLSSGSPAAAPEFQVDAPWDKAWDASTLRRGFERALPLLIADKRWFVSKARGPRAATIRSRLHLASAGRVGEPADLLLTDLDFTIGEPETYALPLQIRAEPAETHPDDTPPLARLRNARGEVRGLYDAMTDPEVARFLLRLALVGGEAVSQHGRLVGRPVGKREKRSSLDALPVRTPRLEQSNSTVFFGDRYVLKLFRRLDAGESPEAEIGRHLSERVPFPNIAPLAGTVDVHWGHDEPRSLVVAMRFMESRGDAWNWILERAIKFYEGAAALPTGAALLSEPRDTPPPELSDLLSEPLEASKLLGARTAELHAALATDAGDAAFTPEPFTPMYQRSLFQSIRNSFRLAAASLGRETGRLEGQTLDAARTVIDGEARLSEVLALLRSQTLAGARIRCHGDYHLGQVLHTGKDFVIIDFEGEPLKSIGERRVKRSPLRDVAGMVRSIDYSAWAALRRHRDLLPGERTEAVVPLAQAARAWSKWIARAFTLAYAQRITELAPRLLGGDLAANEALFRALLLEKVCYEISYELNSRPDWVEIPLRAAAALLRGEAIPPLSPGATT